MIDNGLLIIAESNKLIIMIITESYCDHGYWAGVALFDIIGLCVVIN